MVFEQAKDKRTEMIYQYEEFLEKTLKPKLQSLLQTKANIDGEIRGYKLLEEKIEAMRGQDPTGNFETLVEIDPLVSLTACIPVKSQQRVVIHVGIGVFIDVAVESALSISETRCALLNKKLANVEPTIGAVESDIDQVPSLLSNSHFALPNSNFAYCSRRNCWPKSSRCPKGCSD